MIYVVMDQVLKISDKNAGKIVEGLSLAYFEENMSEEYQAEAIDAFNNGQTQFSIQDDDSIMIYFYQDTLSITDLGIKEEENLTGIEDELKGLKTISIDISGCEKSLIMIWRQ